MIFNDNGILDIDNLLVGEPSFQKIMEDGIVTDEELKEQSEKVLALLQEVESRFSDEDKELIFGLFAEANVLSAIYHYFELQKLTHHGNL